MSIQETLEKLNTSEDGLTDEEASKRIEEYGENRIEEKEPVSPVKIFINQFNDNLIFLLMFALILSLAIGFLPGQQPEYMESGLILLILVANGVFGFFQDYRAERSIAALKEMSTPEATLRRNGEKKEVKKTDIVPGDVVYLEQGDIIPADARLLEEESLDTDESALTGESTNVRKSIEKVGENSAVADRSNMLFMNTHVVKGRGVAVVTGTGMDTEVGSIAEELQEIEKSETPFQREVDQMGKKIGYLVVGIVILVSIIQFILTGAEWLTILLLATGLFVAAIPESLPAIVTFTLALGSRKLLKKNALVRRLPVVETLGSVNYIVTDKTGTLTEGVMTVEKLYFQGEEFDVTGRGLETEGDIVKDSYPSDPGYLEPLLECGVYCNNAERAPASADKHFRGQPTEIALLVSGIKGGLEKDKERLDSIPFSSDRKRMTVIMEDRKAYMKGAPEIVLERCDRILLNGEIKELTEKRKEEVVYKNHELATNAFRVLAFANKHVDNLEAEDEDIESGMVFLGLQAMMDPPRAEVKQAVDDCRTAGIGVVMATGDNVETAKAIGKQLGFEYERAIEGRDLEDMSKDKLMEEVEEVEIFARVSPEHKVRILEALQANGYNVAMTGDGVNDAPALKDSDVGVAMGERGTDVAKKSSDMVLLDDNFVTIRDAIAEGRAIFDNIRKVTNQLLSTNSAEVMLVFMGILIGGIFYADHFTGTNAVVLTAAMILWVNFASDGPPAIALSEDPKVKDIMKRDARDPEEPIIDKKILAMVAFTGPIAAATMLPLFFYHIENFVLAQTTLFMALAFFEIIMFPIIRKDYDLKFYDNGYLLAAILFSSMTHLAILYTPLSEFFGVTPLSLKHWGMILVSLCIFAVIEIFYSKILQKKYGSRA